MFAPPGDLSVRTSTRGCSGGGSGRCGVFNAVGCASAYSNLGADSLHAVMAFPMERPNHRLAALLKGSFSDVVLGEQAQAKQTYGSELWWQPVGEVLLSPDSMDGAAASPFRC